MNEQENKAFETIVQVLANQKKEDGPVIKYWAIIVFMIGMIISVVGFGYRMENSIKEMTVISTTNDTALDRKIDSEVEAINTMIKKNREDYEHNFNIIEESYMEDLHKRLNLKDIK